MSYGIKLFLSLVVSYRHLVILHAQCNLLPMVDTVANRQEVCEAWCVTPNVVSYEHCIGVLTGLSLYGINADDVVLTVMPCPSGGG